MSQDTNTVDDQRPVDTENRPQEADGTSQDDGRLQEADPLRDGEALPDGSRPQHEPLKTADDGPQPADPTQEQEATPLFGTTEVESFRARWTELQAAFVDEPRAAVQRADQLVAEVMETLTAMFSRSKQELDDRWQREGAADTEDLRQALRRYRSLLDQLLRT